LSLKEYHRKRKFDQTPEPRGREKFSRGKLRFVIHLHAATRLHYDFRLELGGVFKSWAVPKGPSLNPLDQRLALFVEDHPLEYGAFEGIIPRGNYGAGTVMIWDQGIYYSPQAKNRKESELALQTGFAAGNLKFILEGKKLRGEFALVRIKRGEGNAWLLLKKRDAFSGYADITRENRSAKSGRNMEEITKQSVTRKSIWVPQREPKPSPRKPPPRKSKRHNRSSEIVVPATAMPRRVRPMLPTFAAQAPESSDWFFETLPEGVRAMAEVEKGLVRLYSRSLLPFERKFPSIVKKLRELDQSLVLDGEIEEKSSGKFIFRVIDLLYAEGKNLRSLPLSERKKILDRLPIFNDVIQLSRTTSLEKLQKFKGYILARKKQSEYGSGTSRDWLKFKSAPPRSRSSRLVSPATPVFSHLDKIMFPADGLTKADVIDYYRTVAPVLLPHLRDRPESLHRHPDGIQGESFFHKDMTSYLPRWIQTTRVTSRSSGKTVNYLVCQNEPTLLYLANYGCIELNPWISRLARLDHPDYVIIDLDPDGNLFDDVIRVAGEVHRVLKSIGVESYCKTSGATGLHICVPIQGEYDYDLSRKFAESVCALVHQKFPRLTSMERSPARRRGLIYLDYMQNRRGQTLAAPYALRPHAGAPVSAPLRWSEVKPGLDPLAFNIRTMPPRLKRLGDLWKPMLKNKVDLKAALKKLQRKNRATFS